MTSPVTNVAFRDVVFALMDKHMTVLQTGPDSASLPMPIVPLITPQFTGLFPDPSISSLLAVTSPWIDIGSVDPIVAHVSRQILNQEIAYAAFCGVNNVIIQGPEISASGDTSSDIVQYARNIAHALSIGPFLQLHISLTLGDVRNTTVQGLRKWVQDGYANHSTTNSTDELNAWDAWDTVRSVCKYNGRLSVGTHIKSKLFQTPQSSCSSHQSFILDQL